MPFLSSGARLSLILLLASAQTVVAQRGGVTGVVVDSETGETLIGVNVVIDGTLAGTSTDIEGSYRLTRLEDGAYDLVFSFVGYERKTVRGVEIRDGQALTLNVALDPEALGLGEIFVEAEAVLSQDAALLRLQAKAPSIMDGISAQQIKRSPDTNSGDALRRVTGVSILGGKFASVRGVPERYNGTLINGTSIATTEPDRRAFSYDILPANLLENIMVAKSATPDLPGDFSGGMLRLNTIDFPSEFTVSASYSSTYYSNTSFKPFVRSPKGSRDYLGMDDGTRRLPADFPTENISNGSYSVQKRDSLAQMFSNNWATTLGEAPVNQSLAFSAGGSIPVGGGRIGVVGALTYRTNYQTSNLTRREFESSGEYRYDYDGNRYTSGVAWGGIFNLSYRPSGKHSLSFKNLYNRTADDEVTELFGFQYSDNYAEQEQYAMRYLSRSVYSGQFIGDHHLNVGGRGIQARWEVFRSFSTRDEPDYRRVIYQREIGSDGPMRAIIGRTTSLKNGGRYFSTMDEDGFGASGHVSIPVSLAKITLGTGHEQKDRKFDARLIATNTRDFRDGGTQSSYYTLPLSEIFDPANFAEGGFTINELRTAGNNYVAAQNVTSAYAMVDLPLRPISSRLRLVGGVRLEQSLQLVDPDELGNGRAARARNENTDLLPSVNLTYAITHKSNVRLAYSSNVNRPELRELAPFNYYDFDTQNLVFGNPDLRQARIQNLDLRVETYPGVGRMLSTSVFYKRFKDAIERVIVSGISLGAERTFRNADFAEGYGVEVESRFGLARLGSYFEHSSILANYTWIRSTVDVARTEATIARTGRPLQGQSPYVINLGLTFVEPSFGTNVNVLYNRLGSRVVEAATAFEADVIEERRDVVDVVLTQPIFGRYELRFAARDMLARDQVFTQGEDVIRLNSFGASYSLGISVRL